MLLAQAFQKLLEEWDDGKLPAFPQDLISGEVVMISFQCLVRMLQRQNLDGSWGNVAPSEETSYAIITINSLRSLPLAKHFQSQIFSAMRRGCDSISNCCSQHSHVWVEKVTYRSSQWLSAYTTTALNISTRDRRFSTRFHECCDVPSLADFAQDLDGELSPTDGPRWLLLAAWIEMELFLLCHQKTHFDVSLYPLRRFNNAAKIKAFRWTLANNISTSPLAPSLMFSILPAAFVVEDVALKLSVFLGETASSASIGLQEHLNTCLWQLPMFRQSDASKSELAGPIQKATVNVTSENETAKQYSLPHTIEPRIEEQIFSNELKDTRIFQYPDTIEQNATVATLQTLNSYLDLDDGAIENPPNSRSASHTVPDSTTFEQVKGSIKNFVDFFRNHPDVKAAEQREQDELKAAIDIFLDVHARFCSERFGYLVEHIGFDEKGSFRCRELALSSEQASMAVLLAFGTCINAPMKCNPIVEILNISAGT
ncbi:MAG: hypothetical protein M1820_010896 [Bogoriella megaspora]|nr:MAG: hypothetical protein M1820_010896 [Bogoriella megaspora]